MVNVIEVKKNVYKKANIEIMVLPISKYKHKNKLVQVARIKDITRTKLFEIICKINVLTVKSKKETEFKTLKNIFTYYSFVGWAPQTNARPNKWYTGSQLVKRIYTKKFEHLSWGATENFPFYRLNRHLDGRITILN